MKAQDAINLEPMIILKKHEPLINIKFVVSELFKTSKFVLSILGSFPTALILRWYIRKNKKLNTILKFPALQEARSNVEKGSCAYDSILFTGSIWSILKNKTHLANLVCIAIIFGDEYIDGIAQLYGKAAISKIIQTNATKFDLKINNSTHNNTLYYDFDPKELFPDWILNSVNHKYKINYTAFYEHLLFLLEEINVQLNKQPKHKQKEIAQLVCTVCNKCFATYIEDVNDKDNNYDFNALLAYQHKKDDAVVFNLLQLRAYLLNKNTKKYEDQFPTWSAMLRSLQIYDDMQDITDDINFQKNLLAFTSKNYFPNEWLWLKNNISTLKNANVKTHHTLLCLNMPGSIIQCMDYAKEIANQNFNWVQLKIQNYLWCKNWLGLYNKKETMQHTYSNKAIINQLSNTFEQLEYKHINKHTLQAHILHTLLLNKSNTPNLLKGLNKLERYKLKSQFIEMPNEEKNQMLKKLENVIGK